MCLLRRLSAALLQARTGAAPIVHDVLTWCRVATEPLLEVFQPRGDALDAKVLSRRRRELTGCRISGVVEGGAVVRTSPPRAATAHADGGFGSVAG